MPRRGAAAIVCTAIACATVALAPGCFDTVSLGEGTTAGQGGDAPAPHIGPWVIPPSGPGDLTGGDLCHPGLTTDLDGDGWTPVQGDCNDCDPSMGPDAVEMPTLPGEAPVDENCNGIIDEATPTCDDGLVPGETSPFAAARALDICQVAHEGRWGVTTAAWVLPDGSAPPTMAAYDLGHGILDGFGPNVPVRSGARLLALSTGTARQPKDPGYQDPRGYDKVYTSKPPEGFPKGSTACAGVESGPPHDAAALELRVRVPQNADALAFDFDFYTYEVPERMCTRYSDLFVTLVDPPPPGRGDGNIAFDAFGNVISVNSVQFEVCGCEGGPPCGAQGRELACSLGASQLLGTGYGSDLAHDGDHGATGWLTAETPVERSGTIRLRFSIHDAEDGTFDSTVLLDHFRWTRGGAQVPRKHLPPD
jgi:hypothetical protein